MVLVTGWEVAVWFLVGVGVLVLANTALGVFERLFASVLENLSITQLRNNIDDFITSKLLAAPDNFSANVFHAPSGTLVTVRKELESNIRGGDVSVFVVKSHSDDWRRELFKSGNTRLRSFVPCWRLPHERKGRTLEEVACGSSAAYAEETFERMVFGAGGFPADAAVDLWYLNFRRWPEPFPRGNFDEMDRWFDSEVEEP